MKTLQKLYLTQLASNVSVLRQCAKSLKVSWGVVAASQGQYECFICAQLPLCRDTLCEEECAQRISCVHYIKLAHALYSPSTV